MSLWIPPWRPGLPQAECAACDLKVIARTLSKDGRCVQCVATKRHPEAAEPAQLAISEGLLDA